MPTVDGLPAWVEAALQDALSRGNGLCPFCGRPYRDEEAEVIAEGLWGERLWTTLRRCGCGYVVLPQVHREED